MRGKFLEAFEEKIHFKRCNFHKFSTLKKTGSEGMDSQKPPSACVWSPKILFKHRMATPINSVRRYDPKEARKHL